MPIDHLGPVVACMVRVVHVHGVRHNDELRLNAKKVQLTQAFQRSEVS